MRKVCDLPYEFVLYADMSDGTPFIGRKGFRTLYRPQHMRHWPEAPRLRHAIKVQVERHDQMFAETQSPQMAKLDRVATLNASICLNVDIPERQARYLDNVVTTHAGA